MGTTDDPAYLRELLQPTSVLDRVRATEFARLDATGHVYLDHTGAGLYPQSLVDGHLAMLRTQVLGNPHSVNPTSRPATDLVESARAAVLAHVGADPAEYACIFTANATGALKLVGESYGFGADRPLLLTSDNHNSVNGIREFARTAGAPVHYLPVHAHELRLDPDQAAAALAEGPPGLFAFPAQSNYSGVQHPLDLVGRARALGWDVLLDAAAFAPTNPVDLVGIGADFLAVSFYKMFGYPTGVGALVARRSALARLRRPWFAGGTIAIASVVADGHRLVPGHAGFEDGTLNFLALPAVEQGLAFLNGIGMATVHDRVTTITGWILGRAGGLQHASGRPLVRILGPTGTAGRGGTITFTLSDPAGAELNDRRVEEMASAAGISLRNGCFCNPGAGETAQDVVASDLAPFLRGTGPVTLCEVDQAIRARRGTGVSALRASVGLATNAADAVAFVEFLAGFLDRPADRLGAAPPPPPPAPDTA